MASLLAPQARIGVVRGRDVASTSDVEALFADTQPRDGSKSPVDRRGHHEVPTVRFVVLLEQLHLADMHSSHGAPNVGVAIVIVDHEGTASSRGSGHRPGIDAQVDMIGVEHTVCILLDDGDAHEILEVDLAQRCEPASEDLARRISILEHQHEDGRALARPDEVDAGPSRATPEEAIEQVWYPKAPHAHVRA